MSVLTTSVGVLTTTFVPTVTSCSSYYIQDNSAGTYFLKFGTVGDASTSSCYPPNFVPLGYYSPGVCPAGYWHACQASIDKTATVATCCPQDYTCKKNRATDDPHQCESKFEQVSWISVSQCFTKNGTPELPCGRFVTTTYTSGDRIFAYGVNLRRAGGDPLWSGTSGDPTATVSNTAGTATGGIPDATVGTARPTNSGGLVQSTLGEDGHLSTGAKIAVGVGVSLGALFIIGAILAAYLIGKRSRRRQVQEKEAAQRQANMQYPPNFPHASPQGADWARTRGPAAELSPLGYDGSTTYGGSSECTSPYYSQQQNGAKNTNHSPWPYELDPSPRSLVELGASEPASSELAGHVQARKGADTSVGPPRQL